MDEVKITFASFTYASKAKKLLAREGVYSRLVKLGTDVGNLGCTHGITVSASDFYKAAGILRAGEIKYRVAGKGG